MANYDASEKRAGLAMRVIAVRAVALVGMIVLVVARLAILALLTVFVAIFTLLVTLGIAFVTLGVALVTLGVAFVALGIALVTTVGMVVMALVTTVSAFVAVFAVTDGHIAMIHLLMSGLEMVVAFSRHFFTVGKGANSALAVEGDMVVVTDYDSAVDVSVADEAAVHMDDRGVIEEMSMPPFAAGEADAAVAEAVVNSAVESNVRAPVAAVPNISAFGEAPVSRRPKQARFRSENPCPRDPVITGVAIGPVAGRPDVVRTGADGLSVYAQRWRADVNGNSDGDLRVRRSRGRKHYESQQKALQEHEFTHLSHLGAASICRAISKTPGEQKSCGRNR